MGTKTIGIREEVYDRLRARKREDESFTDLLDRLLDETTPGWREGFGTLAPEDADELEDLVAESRAGLAGGAAARQRRALEEMAEVGEGGGSQDGGSDGAGDDEAA